MKLLLLLGLTSLFFTEEPSYNFGGRFSKDGHVALIIDVRDGSYWATFTGKTVNGSSPCQLSEKASVKNGTLRIQYSQEKHPINLIISPADHTRKMVVRGLRKDDQHGLMHYCPDGNTLVGEYKRLL